jgi:hypothetical protein
MVVQLTLFLSNSSRRSKDLKLRYNRIGMHLPSVFELDHNTHRWVLSISDRITYNGRWYGL